MPKKETSIEISTRFPRAGKSFDFKEKISKNEKRSLEKRNAGDFIDDRATSQNRIESLLDQYCADAGINPNLRKKFKEAVHALAEETKMGRLELLEMMTTQRDGSATWAKRIEGSRVKNLLLPETAPALWAEEKQPGDTPPTFIKRHYGEHLRSDATGLTRPDIKRLDPQLYTALSNWLRKNELPSDCPLPTKSEALSQTDVTPRPPVSDENTRAYWRAASRESYARRDNKNLK